MKFQLYQFIPALAIYSKLTAAIESSGSIDIMPTVPYPNISSTTIETNSPSLTTDYLKTTSKNLDTLIPTANYNSSVPVPTVYSHNAIKNSTIQTASSLISAMPFFANDSAAAFTSSSGFNNTIFNPGFNSTILTTSSNVHPVYQHYTTTDISIVTKDCHACNTEILTTSGTTYTVIASPVTTTYNTTVMSTKTDTQIETSTHVITKPCHVCETQIFTSTGTTVYTTSTSTVIATVTEPCETTFTVIASPSTNSYNSTVTLYSTIVNTPTVLPVKTNTCDACKTSYVTSTSVTTFTSVRETTEISTVTEPCETKYTVVKSPVTTRSETTVIVSYTVMPSVHTTTVSNHCSVCETHTFTSSSTTTRAVTSGTSVVTVTEPCANTYTVIASPTVQTVKSVSYYTKTILPNLSSSASIAPSKNCQECSTFISTTVAPTTKVIVETPGTVTITKPCTTSYKIIESPVTKPVTSTYMTSYTIVNSCTSKFHYASPTSASVPATISSPSIKPLQPERSNAAYQSYMSLFATLFGVFVVFILTC